MNREEKYASPPAVEAAIATAAGKAFAADPSIAIDERIRLEYFHRFLSRVFSEADDCGWVLKGGTGILARVASARATTDVDLFRNCRSLAGALEDLRRVAGIDLGDFFRFDYTGYSDAVGGNQQAYTAGYRVDFDVYIGAKMKNSLHVDLVTHVFMTDVAEVSSPAGALDLPKLKSNPYRLYPVVDQVADKVCATLALYNGRRSSREKDLVDLVLLAATHDVEEKKLRRAFEIESRARSLTHPATFEVPDSWGSRYSKLASTIPACANYLSISAAKQLMHLFIDPMLDGSAAGMVWDYRRLSWV